MMFLGWSALVALAPREGWGDRSGRGAGVGGHAMAAAKGESRRARAGGGLPSLPRGQTTGNGNEDTESEEEECHHVYVNNVNR